MIEFYEQDERILARGSSKGNQLKWYRDGIWHKADYTGYEGLSEYVVSRLLGFSDLGKAEYIEYKTERVKYKRSEYNGASSQDFLPKGWQIITLERLFESKGKGSLNKAIYQIDSVEERMKFLVKAVEETTGIKGFGEYLT